MRSTPPTPEVAEVGRGLRIAAAALAAATLARPTPATAQDGPPQVGGVLVVRPEARSIVEPPLVVVLEGISGVAGEAPALVRLEIDGRTVGADGRLLPGGGRPSGAGDVEVVPGERVRIEIPELEEGTHRLVVTDLSAADGRSVEVAFTLAGGRGIRTAVFLVLLAAVALGFALIGRRLRSGGGAAE